MKTNKIKNKKKYFKNFPVYTEKNIYLGKVIDVRFDNFSNELLKILVCPSNPLKKIFQGNIEIPRRQIVLLAKDRIIVKDLDVKIKEPMFRPVTF